MTCIATDGKAMAADSRITTGDLIASDARRKLFHAADGSAVGCAGDCGSIALARTWFEAGEKAELIPVLKPVEPDGTNFSALILRPNGKVQMMDLNFAPYEVAAVNAIGSGSEVAIGAMLAGKRPQDAVRLAAARVTSVGGPVRTMFPRLTRKARK